MADVSVMQRVNGLHQASSYGNIKMLPEKDKKGLTILFVNWPREEPEKKKRFEYVPRKNERKKEKLMDGETRYQKKKERERHTCKKKRKEKAREK